MLRNRFIFNFLKNKGIYLLLLASLIWIKELNYLFYDINQSPDFDKYFVYLEHFFNNEPTYREHGLLYYYLQSLHLNFFYSDHADFALSLHKSVGNVNFYLFLIGLIGMYKLLKLLSFSEKSIIFTLIFLIFFPPAISIRLVFKPEILAFALFPWIIFLFEKFNKTKEIKYLTFSIPLIVSIISLKGNIMVIVCVYLLLSNFQILKKLSIKSTLYLLGLFILLFSLVTVENNSSNNKNILDIQSGATLEQNYDNKAPISIIYKTNLYKLFSSPVKHIHASSFISITLLETNGDYFDLYWDNDASEYFKNRKEIINFKQSNEIKAPKIDTLESSITIYQQRSVDTYLHETLGLILSLILFGFLFSTIRKESEYRKYLLAIFVGMGVILIHVITGYPNNNFDPLVGDTFKPLYYSFVYLFSFSFAVAVLANKNKINFFQLIIYCALIVFILGFPKNNYEEVNYSFVNKIENSIFCEIEKNIYLEETDFKNNQCSTEKKPQSNKHFFSSNITHKPINLMLIFFNFLILSYCLIERKIKSLS